MSSESTSGWRRAGALRRGMAIAGGVLAFAGVLPAAQQSGRPESYPKVDLSPQSEPRYTAVAVDWEAKLIAYLCFDGNVDKGYERMFVWIPGVRDFEKPKLIHSADDHKYPDFSVDSTKVTDKELTTINWNMAWGIGGGKYTRRDYSTGETREYTQDKYVQFSFTCDYRRKPRMPRIGRAEFESYLDVSIPGLIGHSAYWTNCPAPIAPWNSLVFYMNADPKYDGKDKTSLFFKGYLAYYDHWKCAVKSIPPDLVISLSVSPYLEPPIYSNRLTATETFQTGLSVDLPYGWYDCQWRIDGTGVVIRSSKDWNYSMFSPQPVPRPAELPP